MYAVCNLFTSPHSVVCISCLSFVLHNKMLFEFCWHSVNKRWLFFTISMFKMCRLWIICIHCICCTAMDDSSFWNKPVPPKKKKKKASCLSVVAFIFTNSRVENKCTLCFCGVFLLSTKTYCLQNNFNNCFFINLEKQHWKVSTCLNFKLPQNILSRSSNRSETFLHHHRYSCLSGWIVIHFICPIHLIYDQNLMTFPSASDVLCVWRLQMITSSTKVVNVVKISFQHLLCHCWHLARIIVFIT